MCVQFDLVGGSIVLGFGEQIPSTIKQRAYLWLIAWVHECIVFLFYDNIWFVFILSIKYFIFRRRTLQSWYRDDDRETYAYPHANQLVCSDSNSHVGKNLTDAFYLLKNHLATGKSCPLHFKKSFFFIFTRIKKNYNPIGSCTFCQTSPLMTNDVTCLKKYFTSSRY